MIWKKAKAKKAMLFVLWIWGIKQYGRKPHRDVYFYKPVRILLDRLIGLLTSENGFLLPLQKIFLCR